MAKKVGNSGNSAIVVVRRHVWGRVCERDRGRAASREGPPSFSHTGASTCSFSSSSREGAVGLTLHGEVPESENSCSLLCRRCVESVRGVESVRVVKKRVRAAERFAPKEIYVNG